MLTRDEALRIMDSLTEAGYGCQLSVRVEQGREPAYEVMARVIERDADDLRAMLDAISDVSRATVDDTGWIVVR
jgi:hypothetical protein